MHKNFADWYQPVSFGHNREIIELRWQGVEKVLDSSDTKLIIELTRLVFGFEPISSGFSENFRNYFKEADSTFKLSGNDQEVITLAGCVLNVLSDFDKYDYPDAPLSILTTSFFQSRAPIIEIGLLDSAQNFIYRHALVARERPKSKDFKVVVNDNKLKDTINKYKENPADPSAIIELLCSMVKNSASVLDKINNLLVIQDEEIQILWWLSNGWSSEWECRFDDIESKARPIMLANEAAKISNEFLEPPSIHAIFRRLRINDKKTLLVQDAINACGLDVIKRLKSKNDPCPIVFPLHFAISKAIETELDSSWVIAWKKKTNIDEGKKFSPNEIAIQMYRESKLLKIIEEENE